MSLGGVTPGQNRIELKDAKKGKEEIRRSRKNRETSKKDCHHLNVYANPTKK
ncbi:hypothetical protein EW15_0804 [Prochlorococcus sp. MIT 0801]|nr:hypothetical protein EW15_0804 [Prochlorococcus sp. MIT 0801]